MKVGWIGLDACGLGGFVVFFFFVVVNGRKTYPLIVRVRLDIAAFIDVYIQMNLQKELFGAFSPLDYYSGVGFYA